MSGIFFLFSGVDEKFPRAIAGMQLDPLPSCERMKRTRKDGSLRNHAAIGAAVRMHT